MGFLEREGSKQRRLRWSRMKTAVASMMLLIAVVPAGSQRLPSIVPPGWTQEEADPETKTRRFVSQHGKAWLQTKQTPADRSALDRDMDDVAYRDGEIITYQKRGREWIAVSGYWGDQIFYRKSNLACGGTRWHHIEFGYPREDKKKMDEAVTRMAHGMTAYSNDCPKRSGG
jgi:hypothetical protein